VLVVGLVVAIVVIVAAGHNSSNSSSKPADTDLDVTTSFADVVGTLVSDEQTAFWEAFQNARQMKKDCIGVGSAARRTEDDPTEPPAKLIPYIRQLPIPNTGGAEVAYYSNGDLTQGGDWEMAAFFFHGATRDSFDYFCTGVDTLPGARTNGDWDPNKVLIIAPTFAYHNDWIVQNGYQNIYWASSRDYRTGARAGSKMENGTYYDNAPSSFTVIDEMMKLLNSSSLFPNLGLATLAGHSAGGQTVQRYAISSHIQPYTSPDSPPGSYLREEVPVRFVVANPSSFTYLDERRWAYHCVTSQQKCSPGALMVPSPDNYRYATNNPNGKYYWNTCEGGADCGDFSNAYYDVNKSADFFCYDPDYNKWAYGLENITDDGYHAYFLTEEEGGDAFNMTYQVNQYAFRDMWYLNGNDDQCSPAMKWYNTTNQTIDLIDGANGVVQFDAACEYHKVDTRCPAMLEGPWRQYRGTHYMAYLAEFYGQNTHNLVEWVSNTNFNLVPGVGHNGLAMWTSAAGEAAIYQKFQQALVDTSTANWRR
jgi:hypothetical protein